MATAQLSPARPPGARHGASSGGPRRDSATRAPALLGGAMLVVLAYAVFAHGSTAAPAEPRVEVVVALLTGLAAIAGLWSGSLRWRASGTALAGIVLLAAFAGYAGVSLVWSVAPDLTWVEFNRTVLYVLVLVIATAFGSTAPNALERTAQGLLALVAVVLVYALLQKVLPGVRLGSLVDLDQTGVLARLQEPLGYWNALALLFAMGAPLALAVAVRPASGHGLRIVALLVLQFLIIAGAFTVSRGGIIAFAVALITCIALGGGRLRALLWAASAVLAALPVVVLGLTSHALSGDGVALGRREHAGILLGVLLVGTGTLLALGAARLLELEDVVVLDERRSRQIERGLLGALAAVVLLGVIAVAASHRGLTGTISHAWNSFTSTKAVSVSSPSRLLTDASGNRWTWWKEALGAFSARPAQGWGAGSFPIVHLLFRQNAVSVQHAHSALFEWLAEDGLLGTLMVLAAWALLVRAAISAVRIRAGWERMYAAALLGAVLAYSVHALIDWDWDIPGVTLPVLTTLGVLLGSARTGRRRSDRVHAEPVPLPSTRLGALALVTVGLCAYALSAALPSIAAGRASAAEIAAAGNSSADLRTAADDASLATRLDPFSDAGPLAAANIALRRHDIALCRALLAEAVAREPSDGVAWLTLGEIDIVTGRALAAEQAELRAREADPRRSRYRRDLAALVSAETLRTTPPSASATAVVTPASP